jgi:hypothetical protein
VPICAARIRLPVAATVEGRTTAADRAPPQPRGVAVGGFALAPQKAVSLFPPKYERRKENTNKHRLGTAGCRFFATVPFLDFGGTKRCARMCKTPGA